MDDLDEIKREISKKSFHEPMGAQQLPHEIIDIEKMIDETPRIAPLFVKIEKYKEILGDIQKLRLSLKNIQFLLAFREQIKKVDTEADELMIKTIQHFSMATNEFSMNFAIPRGASYVPKPPVEEKVDQSVSDLGAKITRLREELDKITL